MCTKRKNTMWLPQRSLHADELNVDMIVLCTHGRSGPARVVGGEASRNSSQARHGAGVLVRPDMKVPSALSLPPCLMARHPLKQPCP